jgi:hypothetical protein
VHNGLPYWDSTVVGVMNADLVGTPSDTLDTTDPGDDTQRRYRYQAAYAAIVSLDLLDEDSEFEEIFCEHHEDTLVRKKDDTHIGIQVKTRAPGRDLFKSNDTQILNALERFVEQEIEYPNQYSRFVLATNYAFWSARKNTKNLHYLLDLAKNTLQSDPSSPPPSLAGYISILAERVNSSTNTPVSSEAVLRTLGKVGIQEDLPKFDDLESRLVSHIPEHYNVGEAGFDDLLRAAKALINRMFEAASLSTVSAKQMYFVLFSDPMQVRTDTIIEGKRITRDTIEGVLRERLSSDAFLRTVGAVSISDLPKGMRGLELKMAKGRISARSIHNAKDHMYSTWKLLDEWIYKYDPERADQRYEQLKVIVGNECQEAYDLAYTPDKPFGQEMLNDVRRRLRSRRSSEPDLFFACTHEHTLGMASILTELCDVWWSEEFRLSEDSET